MDYPSTIRVKSLDSKHASWKASYAYWERLRKMYEGGKTMQDYAEEFLFRRSKEPNDVYTDRVARFAYTNHLGNIAGWYVSALFKKPPKIGMRSQNLTGESVPLKEGTEPKELTDFMDDCDGAGRSLNEFWRQDVQPLLLTYRKAYVLFDLPFSPGFASLEQQKQANALRPHLVAYSPQDVQNWQVDEQGNLDWAVVKVRAWTQDTPFDGESVADRWYIFDRQQVGVYEYQLPKDQDGSTQFPQYSADANAFSYEDNATATLLPNYPVNHALADKNIVPLFVQSVHQNHWIADRVASPLMRLLNLENAGDWGLEQTNLAMLVIYSDRELNQISRSEQSFLQLGSGDKASFLEQSGHAFQASEQRCERLREDVYRLAYLVAQGRSSSAQASMQSGYSKEQDMLPARDVLSALGDQAREGLEAILQAAADRMALNISISVQGLDFPDRSDIIDLEVVERLTTAVEINSPSFERALGKWGVRVALPDGPKELWTEIDQEIEDNPTPNEQQQQQNDQSNAMKLANAAKMAQPRQFVDAVNAA